ncbi:sulfur carrier protein ThiS [Coraliomargarita akajimensis]|uniref:Thiamine biosynthesis protein ThiS n=1 Tax=Coraliomargarita akajimensis (strain DSM 45221 / IAM 15411 / JCM 23193 / KCTC 12865 / 04OKA010-24) TaxID=583355 RepID=D5EPX5_CORAD|nr:sulfur carrier protein ThiS [Coraliomargarita akajimensis]ADE55708.1 thiamine biosynthesis protein ThiS [Coraliomargarita akajimensis DSM 45221]
MKLTVNDEARELPEGASLQALLAELGLAEKKGLAVAVNQSVVPASGWAQHRLSADDQVLVIQATQGG